MSSLSLPSDEQPGQPNNVNAVMANDEAIRDKINGALDDDNLRAALATILGVSAGATVRRGKSIIATEEARTNVAYGTLTTPDRVSSIVLPSDGLICVAYQATWKSSVVDVGSAAIFLGANQLQGAALNAAAPNVQEATTQNANANVFIPLASYPGGLQGRVNTISASTNYTSDVSTGQILGGFRLSAEGNGIAASEWLGGPCYIFAAAGTYDVSVQFKASSGSVTAKNRKLWVWTIGF